jgi:hypothetical protein
MACAHWRIACANWRAASVTLAATLEKSELVDALRGLLKNFEG